MLSRAHMRLLELRAENAHDQNEYTLIVLFVILNNNI